MKITLESTTKIIELRTASGTVPARVWEGKTESGIPVEAWVTRIAVRSDQGHDLAQFELELAEQKAPSAEVQAWPLRLIL